MSNQPNFRYLQISPQNISPNGILSVKDGNPVLSFIIGSQSALLRGRSVTISGNIEPALDGTATPHTASTQADNLNNNMRCGVYGLIDRVTISSVKSGGNQTIEDLRHYGRFISSYKAFNESLADDITFKSQTDQTSTNYQLNKQMHINSKIVTASDNNLDRNTFSINLLSGFFSSNSLINLDNEQGIGGVQVDIHLNSDAQFFNSITQDTTGMTDAQFFLSRLKLNCQVVDLTPEDLAIQSKTPNKTLQYNNFSCHYQTINSSNAILNFNLGASRVKSVFMNFIKSGNLNNLAHDGNATPMPFNSTGALANIKSIVYLKNGAKYPLESQQDLNIKNTPDTVKLDSQNLRNTFGSFIKDSEKIFFESTQLTSNNCNRSYAEADVTQQTDGGIVYACGVNYDYAGGGSADFSGSNLWGCQFDLDLTTNQPNSVYVFVHQENTLVYNKDGISVLS